MNLPLAGVRSGDGVPRVLNAISRLVTVPVEISVTCVTWIVVDVVGRILALPVLLVLGIIAEVQRARFRLAQQTIAREIEAEVRQAVRSRQEVYRQVLLAMERLDQGHARVDPRFTETLGAALVVYETQLDALQDVARDAVLRQRLDDVLAKARA